MLAWVYNLCLPSTLTFLTCETDSLWVILEVVFQMGWTGYEIANQDVQVDKWLFRDLGNARCPVGVVHLTVICRCQSTSIIVSVYLSTILLRVKCWHHMSCLVASLRLCERICSAGFLCFKWLFEPDELRVNITRCKTANEFALWETFGEKDAIFECGIQLINLSLESKLNTDKSPASGLAAIVQSLMELPLRLYKSYKPILYIWTDVYATVWTSTVN